MENNLNHLNHLEQKGKTDEKFIQFKNITKKYGKDHTVIKNISLNIQKGEFCTILGPSGSGKTTLLKMLGGFELPDGGKILVKNIDIKDLPIQRRPTATVFQDYALFPNMNVEKNIAYGLKEIRKPIENLAKDYSKQLDKYFADCVKKAKEKIAAVKKQQQQQHKEIQKLQNQIQNIPLLKEINAMSEDEYDAFIAEIEATFLAKYEKPLHKNIPLKVRFWEFVNWVFNFLNINKNIEHETFSENDALVQKYLAYEKEKRTLNILQNKIEILTDKYNDLDYWLSYWENYPYTEKEWFEQKKITRKLTKAEIADEIAKIIKIVGLENNNFKMPNELSGGMQQRVALARALVIQPDILLLDEPLSALDAKIRVQMQQELKRIHKTFGITFILVTHDQQEALTLSDKVVVINDGIIEQVGTPTEIYDYPDSLWVANFIGQANVFEATYLGNHTVHLFNQTMTVESLYDAKFNADQPVYIMIRPEDLEVTNPATAKISAVVLKTVYKGLMWEVTCMLPNQQIIHLESVNKVANQATIHLTWDEIDMHVIAKKPGDASLFKANYLENDAELSQAMPLVASVQEEEYVANN